MQFDLFEPKTSDVFSASSYDEFAHLLRKSNCSRCPELCAERHHIVVDRGIAQTALVAVGEGPGENEGP